MPDEPNADAPVPKAEIFISRNNQTHGPYPRDVVANWINTGKVNRLDLACTNETPWQPVAKLLWPDPPVAPAPAQSAVTTTGLSGKHLALIIGGVILFVVLIVFAVVLDSARQPSRSVTTKTSSSQTTTTGNAAHDILTTLSPNDQATSLGKSVGEGCVGNYAYFMGMARDTRNAFWSVRCTNGKSYEVMITPDASGSTKVLECDVLQLVTKIRCFEKLQD